MLYDRVADIVIYTPPKCGSSSLHSYYTGWIHVIGPQFDTGVIEKHTTHLPYEAKENAECWMIVRNPYDRASSLYRHWLRWCDEHGSFEFFLRNTVHVGEYSFLSSSLYQFYMKTERPPVRIIKLEAIEDELQIHLPHDNKGLNADVKWTPYCIEFVRNWFAADFEHFDYPIERLP